MLKPVHTTPDPYAPFLLSQGIRMGDVLYISGQAGYDNDGKIVDGGFRAQGEQAFSNLRRALEAGGSSLGDVAKVTIFLMNMGHFKEVVDPGGRCFVAFDPGIIQNVRPGASWRFVWTGSPEYVLCGA
jgi:enamine deaminase RidA (YjgF/YER057c/UK114 family)